MLERLPAQPGHTPLACRGSRRPGVGRGGFFCLSRAIVHDHRPDVPAWSLFQRVLLSPAYMVPPARWCSRTILPQGGWRVQCLLPLGSDTSDPCVVLTPSPGSSCYSLDSLMQLPTSPSVNAGSTSAQPLLRPPVPLWGAQLQPPMFDATCGSCSVIMLVGKAAPRTTDLVHTAALLTSRAFYRAMRTIAHVAQPCVRGCAQRSQ